MQTESRDTERPEGAQGWGLCMTGETAYQHKEHEEYSSDEKERII